MSVNGATTSQLGNNNDISNLYYVSVDQLGIADIIWLPPTVGNTMFHMTSMMFQPLQMKGLSKGLSDEDPYDYIWNFMDVCGPFLINNYHA